MDVGEIFKLFQQSAPKSSYENMVKYLSHAGEYSLSYMARKMGRKFLETGNPKFQIWSKTLHDAAGASKERKFLARILRGDYSGMGRGAVSSSAMGVANAAQAGWSVGQLLNKTPLLTDPKTTYGDFYTNAFKRSALINGNNR